MECRVIWSHFSPDGAASDGLPNSVEDARRTDLRKGLAGRGFGQSPRRDGDCRRRTDGPERKTLVSLSIPQAAAGVGKLLLPSDADSSSGSVPLALQRVSIQLPSLPSRTAKRASRWLKSRVLLSLRRRMGVRLAQPINPGFLTRS